MSSAIHDADMTAEEVRALADARGLASAGRMVMSRHAEMRMAERAHPSPMCGSPSCPRPCAGPSRISGGGWREAVTLTETS